MNTKLGVWLLDKLAGPPATNVGELGTDVEKQSQVLEEPRIRGWTFLDYYSEPEGGSLVPLLVECNFRGRREGEEGW